MMWGCITYYGVGDACRLPEGMDSQLYITILQDYVFTSRDYYKINSRKFLFQQDNSLVHTAKIVKEYIHKSNIPILKWPANSPDISPIENL